MAHDVFISYAAEDREVADEVCGALERGGIKCWIAPSDIPFGANYEESIVDAIASSRLLVLVLSSHSNASPHVKREIQNASVEGSATQIIPLRIEDIEYNKALRYYLGSAQWLPPPPPPPPQHPPPHRRPRARPPPPSPGRAARRRRSNRRRTRTCQPRRPPSTASRARATRRRSRRETETGASLSPSRWSPRAWARWCWSQSWSGLSRRPGGGTSATSPRT